MIKVEKSEKKAFLANGDNNTTLSGRTGSTQTPLRARPSPLPPSPFLNILKVLKRKVQDSYSSVIQGQLKREIKKILGCFFTLG